MALKDKLGDSKLSITGSGLIEPTLRTPSWGYKNPAFDPTKDKLNPLEPSLSSLHNTYDVNTLPKDVTIVNFNKTTYTSIVPKESNLDELDVKAPKNTQVGTATSVVSQIYQSVPGKKYKDLGPTGGRY